MLDRNADYVRFRIQQEIDLKDDEIERLHSRLLDFRSGIEEAQQCLRELDRNISRARFGKQCGERSHEVQLSFLSTQRRRDFHAAVQDLRQAQAAQIDALQRRFQTRLKRSESIREDLKIDSITAQMEEVRKSILIMKEEIDHIRRLESLGIQDANDTFSMSLKSDVIHDLRRALIEKNEERQRELQDARNQMNDCVNAIEELDREHETRTESARHKLELLDTKYEMRVRQLQDEHEHRMQILNAHLQQARMRNREAKRTMNAVERTSAESLGASYRQLDLLRERFVDFGDITVEEEAEINRATNEYKKWKSERDRKLEILHGLRSDNDAMKKELGRLQFAVRFPNTSNKRV